MDPGGPTPDQEDWRELRRLRQLEAGLTNDRNNFGSHKEEYKAERFVYSVETGQAFHQQYETLLNEHGKQGWKLISSVKLGNPPNLTPNRAPMDILLLTFSRSRPPVLPVVSPPNNENV